MGDKVVLQRIRKEYNAPMEIAVRYYGILNVLNNLGLTARMVQLLAHTAIKGTISTVPSKQEFIDATGSSKASVNNMTSRMIKMGLMVKDENKKIRVNPVINLDFTQENFMFQINLLNRHADKQVNSDNKPKNVSSPESPGSPG